MPIYDHAQELKRAEQLIDPSHIGNCLTCKFWEVEQRRTEKMVRNLSLCMQPELHGYQLMVTGASGCNKWQRYFDISEGAEAYTHQGEKLVS